MGCVKILTSNLALKLQWKRNFAPFKKTSVLSLSSSSLFGKRKKKHNVYVLVVKQYNYSSYRGHSNSSQFPLDLKIKKNEEINSRMKKEKKVKKIKKENLFR